MLAVHLAPIALFWTGATLFDWAVCITLYVVRMFFVTGGYHRYFSHRTFKTSRWFQFLLAFGAETSLQKGVLWWAANHRDHHRHSDTEKDPHSRKIYGFWYSHLGWILGSDFKATKLKQISDYAKFRELRWIDKHHLMPPLAMAIVVFIIGGIVNGGGWEYAISVHGISTLLCGFLLSTVFLYHGTFSINSLMHMIGKKRYKTEDESRNHLLLALITLGEGWHNNHHHYQASTRQGFFWWEIDITYYVLKVLSWFGIVWDIKEVPAHIKNTRSMAEARELLIAERGGQERVRVAGGVAEAVPVQAQVVAAPVEK